MQFSIYAILALAAGFCQVQAKASGHNKSNSHHQSIERVNDSKSTNWTGPWNVIGEPAENMPNNGGYLENNQPINSPGYPMIHNLTSYYPPSYPPPNYNPSNYPYPSYSPPNNPPPSYPPPNNSFSGKVIRCGVDFGNAQCPMETGGCCSKDGYCGSSIYFCHVEAKCQSGCWNPSPPLSYSVNGLCGILNNGLPCDSNGIYGPCCSKFGYCGFTPEHCRA